MKKNLFLSALVGAGIGFVFARMTFAGMPDWLFLAFNLLAFGFIGNSALNPSSNKKYNAIGFMAMGSLFAVYGLIGIVKAGVLKLALDWIFGLNFGADYSLFIKISTDFLEIFKIVRFIGGLILIGLSLIGAKTVESPAFKKSN